MLHYILHQHWIYCSCRIVTYECVDRLCVWLSIFVDKVICPLALSCTGCCSLGDSGHDNTLGTDLLIRDAFYTRDRIVACSRSIYWLWSFVNTPLEAVPDFHCRTHAKGIITDQSHPIRRPVWTVYRVLMSKLSGDNNVNIFTVALITM